jgi:hypothetical protein
MVFAAGTILRSASNLQQQPLAQRRTKRKGVRVWDISGSKGEMEGEGDAEATTAAAIILTTGVTNPATPIWQVPTEEDDLRIFNMIRDWVVYLRDQHCFCPEDVDKPLDFTYNVKCYISSPGTEAGNVNDTRGTRLGVFFVERKIKHFKLAK